MQQINVLHIIYQKKLTQMHENPLLTIYFQGENCREILFSLICRQLLKKPRVILLSMTFQQYSLLVYSGFGGFGFFVSLMQFPLNAHSAVFLILFDSQPSEQLKQCKQAENSVIKLFFLPNLAAKGHVDRLYGWYLAVGNQEHCRV